MLNNLLRVNSWINKNISKRMKPLRTSEKCFTGFRIETKFEKRARKSKSFAVNSGKKRKIKTLTHSIIFQRLLSSRRHSFILHISCYEHMLTDSGEDSRLVHRRKGPKVDTLFSSFFSDASERRV